MPKHAITDNPFGDVAVAVYKRKTILTDAQIKALPTSAVELVPAPGAGKLIVPIAAFAVIKSTAGGYTVDPSSSLVLMIGFEYVSGIAQTNSLLADPQNRSIQLPIPYMAPATSGSFSGTIVTVPFATSLEDATNTALVIKDDYMGVSAYTGGHASNTLEITAFYSIVDL